MDEDQKMEDNGKMGSISESGFKEMIVGNRQISFGIAVMLGLVLFVIEKMLFGGSGRNQKGEL